MVRTKKHIPVKFVVGFISNKIQLFILAKNILERKFGKIDGESEVWDFSCTHYYEKEMGQGLKRKFLSFDNLISLKKSYRVKLYTNKLEKKFSEGGLRTINIDPGYISLSKLVLWTTKDRSHRIYLEAGIYADLEMQFADKTFRPFEWTYPDYKTREYINFFNSVRSVYAKQINKIIKNAC